MWKFGEKDEAQIKSELKDNPYYPFVREVTANGVGDASGSFTVVVRSIH